MDKKELKHIAFIMDGNGRWAKKRNLPRTLGHKAGCDRIIEIYDACREKGLLAMSLYAFSTENWNRPQEEIDKLFFYLELFFKKEIKKILRDGSKVVVSGDYSKLPKKTIKVIDNAIELTKDCKNFTLNICLNYGGRTEIIRAVKNITNDVINGKTKLEDINETSFEKYLYTASLPPIDLLIRTSGEQRISNYMLYQLAYSEMMFPLVAWPDFSKEELFKCIDDFYKRDRRFGAIKE